MEVVEITRERKRNLSFTRQELIELQQAGGATRAEARRRQGATVGVDSDPVITLQLQTEVRGPGLVSGASSFRIGTLDRASPEIDSYRIRLNACAVLWNGRKWRGIAYSCKRQLVETWVAAATAYS